MWDQPALAPAFDFHVADVKNEIYSRGAADGGAKRPFSGVDECGKVFFFQHGAADARGGVELDLGVDGKVADGGEVG